MHGDLESALGAGAFVDKRAARAVREDEWELCCVEPEEGWDMVSHHSEGEGAWDKMSVECANHESDSDNNSASLRAHHHQHQPPKPSLPAPAAHPHHTRAGMLRPVPAASWLGGWVLAGCDGFPCVGVGGAVGVGAGGGMVVVDTVWEWCACHPVRSWLQRLCRDSVTTR